MKRFITNKYLLYIFGIILFILIWQIISWIVGDPKFIMPGPFETIQESIKLFASSFFWKCLLTTLSRTIIGFLFAVIFAIIISLFIGHSKTLTYIFKPGITVIKAIPTAALTILFIVLFKNEITPIIIVFIIAFPILYESIIGGMLSIQKEVEDAISLEQTNFFIKNIKLRFPQSLRYLEIGIASSFSLSLKISIMSEVIVGSTIVGIGSQIRYLQANDINMIPVFAYAFNSILIILIIDLLMMLIKKLQKMDYAK